MYTDHLPCARWRGSRRARLGFIGLWLTALLAALAGCGSSSSSSSQSSATATPAAQTVTAQGGNLVALARKQGTVNFYTSADPHTAQEMATTFGKEYGLKVTFTRLTSGPIAARYNAEAQAGHPAADAVVIADEPFFAEGLAKGWFLQMNTGQVPAISTIASKFVFPGSVGVGISRLDGVVVNTNQVTPAQTPQTWMDLLKPQWKGQLITDDPRVVPIVMGQWLLLDQTYGDSYLKAIAKQGVQFVPSLVTGVQSVAAGERKAAFGANPLHVAPLKATAPNAPVLLTHLKGPDFGFTWNAGVSAKSPNPAGGRLFVNWLLSPQGQKIFNGPGNNSVLPSITVAGSPPLTSKFQTLTSSIPSAEQAHLLSLLGLSQ
jgi:iron(III) transport system substrate-binding protein